MLRASKRPAADAPPPDEHVDEKINEDTSTVSMAINPLTDVTMWVLMGVFAAGQLGSLQLLLWMGVTPGVARQYMSMPCGIVQAILVPPLLCKRLFLSPGWVVVVVCLCSFAGLIRWLFVYKLT